MRITYFLIAIFIAGICSSCHKSDCNQEFVGGLINIPSLPDTLSESQVMSLSLTATGRDGCSSLKGFEVLENKIDFQNDIWVSSIISSKGCECTMLFPSFQSNLNYTCKYKGWNKIHFFNISINESITDSFYVK